jgi:hypothetical protein
VQIEDGSSSGIVSDNAQTVVLDDLEFEVIWITCGIADSILL